MKTSKAVPKRIAFFYAPNQDVKYKIFVNLTYKEIKKVVNRVFILKRKLKSAQKLNVI